MPLGAGTVKMGKRRLAGYSSLPQATRRAMRSHKHLRVGARTGPSASQSLTGWRSRRLAVGPLDGEDRCAGHTAAGLYRARVGFRAGWVYETTLMRKTPRAARK